MDTERNARAEDQTPEAEENTVMGRKRGKDSQANLWSSTATRRHRLSLLVRRTKRSRDCRRVQML
jgi:hypothetical protein